MSAAKRTRRSGAKVETNVPVSAAAKAVEKIRTYKPGFKPTLAIILGSGMGDVADCISDSTAIPYEEIPGFPVSTVQGHAGQLILGTLKGVPVVCLKGRIHLYEGIDPTMLRVPIYTLKLLGADALFITSAVGSLRPEVGAGELVLLSDHINFQGRNPLVGPNDSIGLRFPSMKDAYDPQLRTLMHKVASAEGIRLHDGVYLACLGPSFETPAEIRAFKILGADVVGMSTVPEVILARHCDLRVLAMSIVVNLAAGLTQQHITHEETLFYSKLVAEHIQRLLYAFLARTNEWAPMAAKPSQPAAPAVPADTTQPAEPAQPVAA